MKNLVQSLGHSKCSLNVNILLEGLPNRDIDRGLS